jgi:hypothetical protein
LVLLDETLLHETILRVLDKLSEADDQTPWVRFVDLKPLEQDLGDLLLDDLLL